MKTLIFVNRWGSMLHLLLGRIDGDTHRRLRSRFCHSLEEARQVVARWQADEGVPHEDVRDNTALDLDELIGWMDLDLEDANDAEVAGVVG